MLCSSMYGNEEEGEEKRKEEEEEKEEEEVTNIQPMKITGNGKMLFRLRNSLEAISLEWN